MKDFLTEPVPHDEAADFIKSKPAVSRAVFNKLLPELKARAFAITGLESATAVQNVRDAIAELPRGGDWDTIKKQIADQMSPYFIDDLADAETQAGQKMGADRRADLLLRLHGFQAYSAAAYRALDEQRDVFPYWQYKSMGDGKVRATHRALHDTVLPAGDPFWSGHYPPWEWGCRCQVVGLMEIDAEEIRDADKDKPLESRRIIEGEARRQLENGNLVKGPNLIFDVRTPKQKGKPDTFSWDPADLRLNLAQLKARYDAPVWDAFESWARAQEIPGQNRTVWQWMTEGETENRPQWPDLSTLKKISALGGSTGATLMQSPDGRRFVVKRGNSAEHIRDEFAADEIYRALGANVPEATLVETPQGPTKIAEFIEGQSLKAALAAAKGKAREQLLDKVRSGFAADALLGNYDVIGMDLDNILVSPDGKVWRIDNGGSLDWRAQGKKKTVWDQYPTEIWTMRDPAINPSSATIFGTLDIYDIARQIEALPDVADPRLTARQTQLRDIARKALDFEHDKWKASYTDDLVRHIAQMRRAGVFDTLSARLTQAVGDVVPADENGIPWDHLRARKASAQAPDPYVAVLSTAAKTINHHNQPGDLKYNKASVQAALALKASLQALAQNPATASQAAHYLAFLSDIESAAQKMDSGQGAAAQIVKPWTSPTAAGVKKSCVELFNDYCQANGLTNAPASHWMAAQGGSSWNADAVAYKHFIAQNLTLDPASMFWGASGQAGATTQWGRFKKIHGAAIEQSLIARHALAQEVLARVEMRYNDRDRRAVRLCRTEKAEVIKAAGLTKGKNLRMRRGANESSSIFRKVTVYGSEVTLQAVPHSRITSLYLLERDPGVANCSFLTDSENEFTFVAPDLPFDYVGSAVFSGESNAAAWKLDLSHIRTP